VVTALAEDPEPALYAGRLNRDVLAGGNMAIRVGTLTAVGGFDERFGPGSRYPAAEDNDLGFRLLEAGFRVDYVPAATLEHRAWRPAGDYLPLRYAYGRGKGAFYVKHARASDLHMVRRLAADLLRRASRVPRYALHPRRAVGEIAYAAGVVRGALAWTFMRHPQPGLDISARGKATLHQ
jgi:GT2 family glycosyltransferase